MAHRQQASLAISFQPLEAMTNKVKEKEKKKKRSSIYLNSKGRHEAGDDEFIIVQSIKEPLGIGNATPPQVVLSIGHEAWGKHEL